MSYKDAKRQFTLVFILWCLGLIHNSHSQTYEVAEIDCAVGHGGKELLTARLRKPDGFRGTPIFADDRGYQNSQKTPSSFEDLNPDSPCQIYPDPLDSTGRVFVLKILDFGKCGVLKRDGFVNVRVWFPQLPGVVMLSDQEVIIMCKPPQPTVLQSKAAGFAGSIPKGPRVTGVVEESPGQLEYEVALFRETTSNSGRSVVSGGAYLTGTDSQELPVEQAVPIGTRLQLRAKISATSAWQHAKLLDVSVSPDPKNPLADGAVPLVKNGCRNPDLASIIPKQPYRYKERTNEVVLDFEAFLLSNMGDRNTLWLHTQIKACMEPLDCESEVCIMDIYQPASYGKRRRRRDLNLTTATTITTSFHNETVAEYSSPLLQHWKTVLGPSNEEALIENREKEPDVPNENRRPVQRKLEKVDIGVKNGTNAEFGDNIGFSVIMPPDYYRSDPRWDSNPSTKLSTPPDCRGWILACLLSLFGAIVFAGLSCVMNIRIRKSKNNPKGLFPYEQSITPTPSYASSSTRIWTNKSDRDSESSSTQKHHHSRPHTPSKYARDSSIYRQ